MITIDSTSHASNAASHTVSVNHTVAPGAGLFVACMAIAGNQGFGSTHPFIATPTFNGVSMTLIKLYDTDFTAGSQAVGIYYLANPATGTHSISFTHTGDFNGGINYNGAVIGLSVFSNSGIGVSDSNHGANGAQVTLTTIGINSLVFNAAIGAPTTTFTSTGSFLDALFSGTTNFWYSGGYSSVASPGNSVRNVTMSNSNPATIVAVEITSIPWGGLFLKMV